MVRLGLKMFSPVMGGIGCGKRCHFLMAPLVRAKECRGYTAGCFKAHGPDALSL